MQEFFEISHCMLSGEHRAVGPMTWRTYEGTLCVPSMVNVVANASLRKLRMWRKHTVGESGKVKNASSRVEETDDGLVTRGNVRESERERERERERQKRKR